MLSRCLSCLDLDLISSPHNANQTTGKPGSCPLIEELYKSMSSKSPREFEMMRLCLCLLPWRDATTLPEDLRTMTRGVSYQLLCSRILCDTWLGFRVELITVTTTYCRWNSAILVRISRLRNCLSDSVPILGVGRMLMCQYRAAWGRFGMAICHVFGRV